VPVGDEKEALGLVLQRQPAAQGAEEMADVQLPGGADAADDTLLPASAPRLF
jgi:hypothetical protein